MRRILLRVAVLVAVVGSAVVAGVSYAHRPSAGHPSALVPRDTSLRHDWLYFYPARVRPARAVILLLGNDVAFWAPHQDLAWRFAGDGSDVIGLDLRAFLATLPDGEPRRDSAFAATIGPLVARARHELGADTLPLVVGGHSFGAEVAFWLAWHEPPPRLVGVLSLNARSSGHLFITPQDWLNEEASGAFAFSTIEAARRIDPRVRIALVRSAHDPFRRHDPDFIAAGGPRLRRFEIPMAGHSLKTMLVAGPLIARALRFLLDAAP